MTCAHCEELEERVAWLESELGVQNELTDYDAIYRAILRSKRGSGRLPSAKGAAKIAFALYRADGERSAEIATNIAEARFGSRADKLLRRFSWQEDEE